MRKEIDVGSLYKLLIIFIIIFSSQIFARESKVPGKWYLLSQSKTQLPEHLSKQEYIQKLKDWDLIEKALMEFPAKKATIENRVFERYENERFFSFDTYI